MPTYDYICDKCQHTWEEFQPITAAPTKKCPSCGKLKARRQIGPGAGIIFKGSGFYETDYRSDSYKKAADADTKSQSAASESKSSSTESKSGGSGGESKSSSSAKSDASKKD